RGLPEVLVARDRDALVDRVIAVAGAVHGVAVARVVLGGGEHAALLVAVDRGLEPLDEPRVLAEGLVRTAPAVVARGADAGRERPLRAGRAGLFGGDLR